MGIKEIEKRLAEINETLNKKGGELSIEEIEKFDREVAELTKARNKIIAEAEQRKNLLDKISAGVGTVTMSFVETDKVEEVTDPAAKPEYRSAWLKKVRGIELNDAEKRAYSNTVGNGAEVIPTQTANKIIEKIKQIAPILEKTTLLHVKGNVRFAVEGNTVEADLHAENAPISAGTDPLVEVSLGGYEIVKLIQISKTVMTMSIDAFEAWIVNMLSKTLARKIVSFLINGTGSGQPKGIEKSNTWDTSNSVSVTKAGSLTSDDVYNLIGLLKGGYDATAVFVMTKRTLFTDFMPLQDKGKNNLVTVEGRNYFISGYPVQIVEDEVKHHEAYLGSLDRVVANLAEDISVISQFDIDTNSVKFLGTCIFDCTPAIGEAFVKLVKKTS